MVIWHIYRALCGPTSTYHNECLTEQLFSLRNILLHEGGSDLRPTSKRIRNPPRWKVFLGFDGDGGGGGGGGGEWEMSTKRDGERVLWGFLSFSSLFLLFSFPSFPFFR